MKILIAISSKEYSGSTLNLGMKVASALKASTTIVDVGDKINEFGSKDVSIANQLMASWDFNRPGVEVLEWAHNFLAKNNFIEVDEAGNQKIKNKLVEGESNRSEVYLKGKIGNNLSLILRNGDIIGELRAEVQYGDYDVTIIGGSEKRNMGHDLIQYIDSSIFVVKDFNPKNNYRILLVVDDSPNMQSVMRYGARIAQSFNIDLDFITVSKNHRVSKDYEKIRGYVAKYMRRCKVNYKSLHDIGNPEEKIVAAAAHNHIIVMGASSRSPLAKFFRGSIPLDVMKSCNCPILIVKSKN